MKTKKGSCHCGAVRFEVDLDHGSGLNGAGDLVADDCNCSICRLSGYQHIIVSRGAFRLLQGAEWLHTYTFHTRAAKHRFCGRCGVKSFYVPRSHPEGVSVNARCLELSAAERAALQLRPFDGANWEASVDELRARNGAD